MAGPSLLMQPQCAPLRMHSPLDCTSQMAWDQILALELHNCETHTHTRYLTSISSLIKEK